MVLWTCTALCHGKHWQALGLTEWGLEPVMALGQVKPFS